MTVPSEQGASATAFLLQFDGFLQKRTEALFVFRMQKSLLLPMIFFLSSLGAFTHDDGLGTHSAMKNDLTALFALKDVEVMSQEFFASLYVHSDCEKLIRETVLEATGKMRKLDSMDRALVYLHAGELEILQACATLFP